MSFSFFSRFKPHSWERWLMVGVSVVVHLGSQETRRWAARQRALGQVRTQLLLQVTSWAVSLQGIWSGFQSCFHGPGLSKSSLLPETHLNDKLCLLKSSQSMSKLNTVCLLLLYLNPGCLLSLFQPLPCDSYCSLCSHWKFSVAFYVPTESFFQIDAHFPQDTRETGQGPKSV